MRGALSHILADSEPNPTLVVNRRYDVLVANTAAVELLSFFAPKWKGKNNVFRMLVARDGLRDSIVGWNEAAGHIVRRLRAELGAGARDAQDDEILAHANAVHEEILAEPAAHAQPPSLRIETFFDANAESRAALETLVRGPRH